MLAHKLKVVNYKSLGESRNELSIAKGITVIIGKNESGKTNLLEAAGEIDFSRSPYLIDNYKKKLSRYGKGEEIEITLTLKDWANSSEISKICATKDSLCISGSMVERLKRDEEIGDCLFSLGKINKENRALSANYFVDFCANPYRLIEKIEKLCVSAAKSKNSPLNKAANSVGILSRLKKQTEKYAYELPYLLFVNNDGKNSFREFYFLEEIGSLDKEDILLNLLDAALVPPSLIGSKDRKNELSSKLIQSGLDRVANAFSLFAACPFSLGYEIKGNRFYLTTHIDGKKAMLDELDVSKKWFFALFVEIMARKIQNKSILFVLDQPGLFMHVLAQKELLGFFTQIAASGHQIIYTTHSPFLLDINDMASIRAVEKQNGQTNIYNKIYAAENSKKAKLETLTPILEALGVGFSPESALQQTRLNLIVEGISDYYYIKAMLHYLYNNKVPDDSLPYVLPSVGASNIANVASILIGWGQPFKAIVDYDEEGNKALEKMENKLGLVRGKDVFFVNGKKTYRIGDVCRIEEMIDREDRRKVVGGTEKQTKAILSKEFYDLVLANKLTPNQKTIKNFQTLFSALGNFQLNNRQ